MYPFERFTNRAKKVLTLAQEEAERRHHSYIGTEHLLLGLMREGEGVAAIALDRLKVEINTVRTSIESALGRNEGIIIQQIIPTSRVKRVIEIAFEEARKTGQNYVGTEHLLLALMLEGEGIAAHVLQDLGVTVEKVRTEVERAVQEAGREPAGEGTAKAAPWARTARAARGWESAEFVRETFTRQNFPSGTPWEGEVGYSRAVRVGRWVHVSGTTAALESGKVVGEGDVHQQTVQALATIAKALEAAGAGLRHVVRTRIYVTNIDDWPKVAQAHRSFFGDIRPATTLVEVRRLIDPAMLVEIEAEAFIGA